MNQVIKTKIESKQEEILVQEQNKAYLKLKVLVARENAKLKTQNIHRERKIKVSEILETEKKEFGAI